MMENRLVELDKQQGQLLQWALKSFPEETIIQENKRLNRERKVTIETRIESVRQPQINADSVIQTLKVVRANLDNLSFESKRMALDALDIKVIVGEAG